MDQSTNNQNRTQAGNPSDSPFNQQRPIPNVKHIIAVSSGKGGVGKSTVAANLALAFSKLGFKVGLLDADIYGPSVPRLFGLINQRPEIKNGNRILPIQRYGISLMSIGFLISDDSAVVWRGPMLFKAMEQFLRDVEWGELDYLIVDLPPGTGDIQLSLAQKVPVSGAVLVSTPQNLSLIDVKRAYDMWTRIGVPIAGFVENMSFLELPGEPAPEKNIQLFPKGDLTAFFQKHSVELLGELPFNPQIGLACESGIPIVFGSATGKVTERFIAIAEKVNKKITG